MVANPFRIDDSATSWGNPARALRDENTGMGETPASVESIHGLLENAKVQVQLADVQMNPNSPLYSIKSFEDLGCPEPLLKGIYAMNFNRPSKIQERALPLLLTTPPQNMLAQAQSGSGKTAAFVLAMLCRVDPNVPAPQALCICPGRELARQIFDVVTQMAKFTTISVGSAWKEESHDNTPRTSQVVIGTPGTILDLNRRRVLDLKQVKVLVFDEADVMLDKAGMGTQSVRVKNACPENVQTLLFSATFNDNVINFSRRVIRNPNILTIERQEMNQEGTGQFFIRCRDKQHKMQVLVSLYGFLTIGQSIIFVNTRACADEIQARMELEGYQISNLHGGMAPGERDRVIDAFRRGETKVLIATNVLARGLDIPQVTLVVNYDIPVDQNNNPDPETYLHRIGRTGRFGRGGLSITLVHDSRTYGGLKTIEQAYNKPIVELNTTDPEALDRQLGQIEGGG